MRKKYAFIFALLLTLLITSNVLILKNFSEKKRETIFIEKVIDGDTIVTSSGETIRLLNINAPEKNIPHSDKAADFLKKFINRSIEVEKISNDKYKRTLARLYAPEYLNLEIVKQGFACKFLVDSSEIEDFARAEKEAVKKAIGIWVHSEKYGCFSLKIDEKKEKLTLVSKCGEINVYNWIVKDESRKEYKFKNISFIEINLHSGIGKDNMTDIFWNSKTNIWNDDRDTVYLYDSDYKIVHHEDYGY